jgi:trimethyllysine dioxygenase
MSIRLNSSSTTSTTEEQGTPDDVQTEVPQQEKGGEQQPTTYQLKAFLGEENVNKAKELNKAIRGLGYELNQIYGRQRVLKRWSSGPHRVRIGGLTQGQTTIPEIRVVNKVIVKNTSIPNVWLRDNCQCGSCMHDVTKQRLLDTFSIPKDIAIKSHSVKGEGEDQTVKIEWSDGHESDYSSSFLAQATNHEDYKAIQRQGLYQLKLWDSSIASKPPKVKCHTVMNNDTIRLLRNIRKYGFCYVDDTPFKGSQDTKALLEKIAFIRETHYGGFYDFTADLASKDTAYTNIALEAHTDTTYFSDPAGLQAFHLLSHTEGSGGASLLVDGFKAANELHATDREAYNILSTVNIHAHASGNDGISIQAYRGFPVLEHDPATGDLLRVRWNSSDRASIELPIDQVETWYDAARKFDAILKKKENEYWEQLVPGRVLIFDNWRMLHGRSEFTGKRRICGGYINRDDWVSRFKMNEFGRENVLKGLAVN